MALFAAPATAQNTLPGLENFTLERSQPPAPTTAPTPTPSPTPSASQTLATPSPEPTSAPTPAATAPPVPIAPPTIRTAPLPRPSETAVPVPVPTVTAGAAASPLPSPAPLAKQGGPDWLLWIVAALAVLITIAVLAWWRRRDNGEPAAPLSVVAEQPQAPDIPPPPIPSTPVRPGGLVTSSLKPAIAVELAPQRGGVDALRATLEYVLQVANTGRAAARDVTVETWLLSAGHDTAADLDQLFAAPADAPMLAPFDLLPGAAIDLTGVATAPREVLATITAGERRSVVPILATRIGYRDSRGAPQVATAAFLIGIARAGQDRLAPLPLDRGAEMRTGLKARHFAN